MQMKSSEVKIIHKEIFQKSILRGCSHQTLHNFGILSMELRHDVDSNSTFTQEMIQISIYNLYNNSIYYDIMTYRYHTKLSHHDLSAFIMDCIFFRHSRDEKSRVDFRRDLATPKKVDTENGCLFSHKTFLGFHGIHLDKGKLRCLAKDPILILLAGYNYTYVSLAV